ncbi:MAG: radical SAM protein [bacterium]|nr:radical SAM protein [bacterium]
MKAKVLLINPPYPFEEAPSPPMGLMSLAAYIRQEGFRVQIADFVVNPYDAQQLQNMIKTCEPDVVGLTGVTMNINKSLKIAGEIKKENPGITIVMGGPHVSFDAENILNDNAYVDCIVRGEGEITFIELLRSLTDIDAWTAIQGLSYKKNNAILHNENRPFIADINTLPLPARDLIKLSKYKALGFAVNMVTSRGCPHKCIFCVGSKMVGNKVRYFDVTRVVDEFEMLSKMGFKQLNIVDDLFTSNKKRCIAICEEITRRNINHPWSAFARVDTVSQELLHALKQAGCGSLCFGIESGNQEILDTVKKKINLDMCKKAVALCKEAGIEPAASYILGLPGETPHTIEKTLAFADSLQANYGYHILSPFPGSEVREKNTEYGLRILSDDWDLYDANQAVTESDGMPGKTINEIYNNFDKKFKEKFIESMKLYDKNLLTSDHYISMVKSFKEFEFASQLISKNLVTKYQGAEAVDRDELISDFGKFISEHTTFKCDNAADELNRLHDMNCIDIHFKDSKGSVAWAEYS